MSRILLLAAMALLCPAQQTPVAGVFRDAGGTLRILQGVPGGWVAPVAIPERVDSAGFNGRWMWYKVGGDLHVRDPRGGWAVASAPGGRAAAVFSDDGRLAGFVFPDAGLSAEWVSGAKALGELHPWLDDAASPLPPEQIGEGLYQIGRASCRERV